MQRPASVLLHAWSALYLPRFSLSAASVSVGLLRHCRTLHLHVRVGLGLRLWIRIRQDRVLNRTAVRFARRVRLTAAAQASQAFRDAQAPAARRRERRRARARAGERRAGQRVRGRGRGGRRGAVRRPVRAGQPGAARVPVERGRERGLPRVPGRAPRGARARPRHARCAGHVLAARSRCSAVHSCTADRSHAVPVPVRWFYFPC